MPDQGLTSKNWHRVLADKAEKEGWSICVGAGISKPFFPDWLKLVEQLIHGSSDTDLRTLVDELKRVFSLDILIEATRDRFQLDEDNFAEKLSTLLYTDFKSKVEDLDLEWPDILQGLTARSPGQMTRAEWADFLKVIQSVSPKSSALQIAETIHNSFRKGVGPSAVITFNAEPLLYALINAVCAREAAPEADLKECRMLDLVTRGISSRKAGHIPFIFCHGLLPVEGGRDLFNKSTDEDKRVFSEGEYLQLANSSFSWQSSLFLGTAVLRSMVFVGLSFTDPNLRRWLAWIQKNKIDELKSKKTDKRKSKDEHKEVYGHYWIKSLEGTTEISCRWYESAVRHLGVRLVWIDSWEQIGKCLYEMLDLSL